MPPPLPIPPVSPSDSKHRMFASIADFFKALTSLIKELEHQVKVHGKKDEKKEVTH